MRFFTADVFTEQMFGGNQLAVFPEAADVGTRVMQSIARELNISETVFVFPPENPAHTRRIRIFTPAAELPFAGHPTLGTCHAWLQAGAKPRRRDLIVQECKKGLVNLRREGDRLAFAAPGVGLVSATKSVPPVVLVNCPKLTPGSPAV